MMTKKERAEVDAMLARVETLAALRWTEAVAPDLAPPKPASGDPVTQGWGMNTYSQTVRKCWSKAFSHGDGEYNEVKNKYGLGSQEGMRLFSTRLLALRAMRHEVEKECAERLRRIDKMIEAELKDSKQ